MSRVEPNTAAGNIGSTPAEIVDVFLCHNSADKSWVETLAEHIESESVDGTPNGRRLRVFFDKWDIDVGQNFVQRINDGLAKARFVAVIISPEFLNAPWTGFEWTHIVSQDPANLQARLIPIFRRERSLDESRTCDLPAPFRALNWLDFRRDSEFKRAYQRLIRKIRGLPPPRGKSRRPLAGITSRPLMVPDAQLAAAPDRIHDLVLSNLLPVTDYPQTIWSAPTSARIPSDVWSQIEWPPPYILKLERLYAFSDLANPECPFRKLIDNAGIEGAPITAWRSDAMRWPWFIELMNHALKKHLGAMGIRSAKRGRYFFVGNKDGSTRVQKNAGDFAREVAARKVNAADKSVFWVHHGAELRFHTLGEGVFLGVEPCYIFTADGRTPLAGPRVTPLSMKWGGKERNASILRHVIFWARSLGRGRARIEIQTAAKPITLLGIPATARANFGIEFDHIALKTLIAQVDDELAEVAKSLEGIDLNHDQSGTEDDHEE